MMNQKFKGLALIYLVAIILLFGTVLFFTSTEPSITGFVVADNLTNETQSDESIVVDTVINESINETQTIVENETKEKGKPDKAEKEKPEPNTPPVWKADVDELIINGKTTIDLNNYFEDKNNDTIGYAAIASEPDKISFDIAGSLITIPPAGDNFNSNITIAASDGDKSTTKEVKLIVPERTITIDLEYKSGSVYDADNDGRVATTDIVDLTVEETNFNWDVNEDNLCTRWDTYSVDDQESTIVCYGSSRCCQFVDLLATRPVWDEPFHSAYGTYGATSNNVISAQVLYVDYELAVEDPFAEIYNSKWSDLSASYFFEFYNFHNVCVDTCTLTGFNDISYTLIFEIEGATIELDTLTYTLVETIDNVLVNLAVEDSQGITSGTYTLLKDNVIITDEFVEPDYYDLEIIPEGDYIEKLSIYKVNIIDPLTADIGVDNVGRQQEIKDVEIIKQYAIDTSELEFETAILTATATANSLFKCKQWAYEDEVCFGTWEKIKDLTVGEEYSIAITQDDPGFVEGNLNITIVSITEVVLIKNISDISIAKNNNYIIDLSQYFSNIDSTVVFTYNSISNISIVFENNIATIVPDKDYIGAGFTFITVDKEGITVSSNIFKITVTNVTIDITPKITSKKKDFKFDEDIELDFEFLEKENLVGKGRWKEWYEVYEEDTDKTEFELGLLKADVEKKGKQIKKWQTVSETIETFVIDSRGIIIDIDVEIEELREGKFKISLPKKREFRPGKFTIRLDLIKEGINYTQEQDLTWGVLAINVNKSIYLESEDSFIGIAILDDTGLPVCNASVILEITDPLNNKEILSTENGLINISPECEVLGHTDLPDYYTEYTVNGAGTYLMNLTADTYNGVRSLLDNFSVQTSVDFDVARNGPTRVFTGDNYTMNFTINANKNYNGIINEFIPVTFGVTLQPGLTVTESGDVKILSWDVDLKKGDTLNFNYEFDPEDISPYFFLMGKLQIGSWQEFRNWQIAADPAKLTFEINVIDGASPVEDATTTFAVFASCGGGTCENFNVKLGFATGIGGQCSGDTNFQIGSCGSDWFGIGGHTELAQTTCTGGNFAVDDDATFSYGATGCASGELFNISYLTRGCDQGGYEIEDVTAFNQKAKCLTLTVVAGADTTPPGVNITNINQTNGQVTRINDVLNISCQSFDDPTVGNITFNLTGSLDLYNFSFTLPGTNANFSQNITMNVTRGNVINATCWAADSNGNLAQNSTLITIANRLPTAPTMFNTTNLYFNANQTFNITPHI